MSASPPRPFFSVILTTRNAAPFIERCVDSLRSQRFLDWECIAIDDASQDETWERLCRAKTGDRRIDTRGLSSRLRKLSAFLYATTCARGSVLVELDGDDAFAHEDALSEIRDLYGSGAEATAGRNRDTMGRESRLVLDFSRPARFHDLSATACAPRTFLASLLLRARREFPGCFHDPETGAPWTSAADFALFAPILHLAGPMAATPTPVYEINMQNPESDWVLEPDLQRRTAERLHDLWRPIWFPEAPKVEVPE